jgi:hypothetical protein
VLPPAARSELAQVARFEAESQFPLPLAELIWDFTLTPLPGSGPHAVIVGARRGLVDERVGLLREAGAVPVRVQPAPLAAAATLVHPPDVHLLVIAGSRWSDLCLYHGDRLLASRSVLAGDPAAEGWAARITREVQPWLAAEEHPRSLVLLGAATPMLADMLAVAAGLPVALGDPWERCGAPRAIREGLDEPAGCYAVAAGLALAALRGDGLNLLPAQITAAYRQRRTLLGTAAVLLLVAGLLWPVLEETGTRLLTAETRVATMAAKIAKAKRAMPVPPGAGLIDAQGVVEALDRPESRPLELLRDLSDPDTGLPAKILLADFTFDRGKGTVILKGHADSDATVAEALQRLAKLDTVARATLDSVTAARADVAPATPAAAPAAVPSGYDFQITCLLPSSGDPTLATRAHGTRPSTGGAQ